MPWSVNEIKNVLFTVNIMLHLNGMALNGNTSFFFKVHIVKHLSFCDLYGFCALQKSVGKCTLTMVNMSDNAKISDVFHQSIFR